MRIWGLSIGELISLLVFVGTVGGFVIKFSIISPLTSMVKDSNKAIDNLNITIQELREDMKESKADRGAIHTKIDKNQADTEREIALLKKEDKTIWKHIAEMKGEQK